MLPSSSTDCLHASLGYKQIGAGEKQLDKHAQDCPCPYHRNSP